MEAKFLKIKEAREERRKLDRIDYALKEIKDEIEECMESEIDTFESKYPPELVNKLADLHSYLTEHEGKALPL